MIVGIVALSPGTSGHPASTGTTKNTKGTKERNGSFFVPFVLFVDT
jgi:hypothetical protein